MYSRELFDRQIDLLLQNSEVRRMQDFVQHGETSTLDHSLNVADMSYRIARRLKLKVRYEELIRGAMLHDFYLYDWHEKDESHRLHGFFHPQKSLDNALKHFDIGKVEADIIGSHMWPLTIRKIPKTRESALVCTADKMCSLLETFSNIRKKILSKNPS